MTKKRNKGKEMNDMTMEEKDELIDALTERLGEATNQLNESKEYIDNSMKAYYIQKLVDMTPYYKNNPTSLLDEDSESLDRLIHSEERRIFTKINEMRMFLKLLDELVLIKE